MIDDEWTKGLKTRRNVNVVCVSVSESETLKPMEKDLDEYEWGGY